MLTVLIVDDERLARSRLSRMLTSVDNVKIVGQCANGQEALKAIQQYSPDLVFLDVQMPQMNGFEVVRSISPKNRPVLIFVTAFDQYAIKAFEVNAVDYLLKPFDQKRFRTALRRAQKAVALKNSGDGSPENIHQLIDQTRKPESFSDRILIRSDNKLTVIKNRDVEWVESAGNYVYLHIGNKTHLHRQTMKELEDRLAEFGFIRVHRSAIINSGSITEIRIKPSGDGTVLLESGTRVNLSRRYRSNLKAAEGK
ncbi:MAG: response regulator [candidate division Zixibacteria bacterium]